MGATVDNACCMMLFVLGALGLPRAVCWDAAKSSVAAAAAGLGTCSPPLHRMLCMTDMCVCVGGGVCVILGEEGAARQTPPRSLDTGIGCYHMGAAAATTHS